MNWLFYGLPCFALGLMAKDALSAASLRSGAWGSEIVVSIAVWVFFVYVCIMFLVFAVRTLKGGTEEEPPA